MNDLKTFIKIIAQRLSLPEINVKHTLLLIDEGATIPFIARYRKERTGGMEDVQLEALSDLYTQLKVIEKRKESILKTIEELDKLTPSLKKQIDECFDAQALEDLYLPYKPKRKTRAEVARQRGLENLSKRLLKQQDENVIYLATLFLNKEVSSEEDALAGARDIIAELVNEHPTAREIVRSNFAYSARIICKVVKGKEEEGVKYKDYFSHEESLKKISSHRILAALRGEREGVLRIAIIPDEEKIEQRLLSYFIKSKTEAAQQVSLAVLDAYKRLLKPSIEKEFFHLAKEKADNEAIKVFVENLRQLLLAAPLGAKKVLAIDPGYRTGCKIVCLNTEGDLVHNETIYIHPPTGDFKTAARKIATLAEAYKIEAIAIGNGTGGRETESFIKKIKFNRELQVFSVSESGASIYSASSIAREEFPDYDVTVRGSVSIGRRLMDPLAELVKIDPKSIGVGQYQHDVDQHKMKIALERVVESCVNAVGVNLNMASKHILTHISGLGPTLAQNIVDYRKENGAFKARKELSNVPRMGAKAYEQCAGFLRIGNASNPLDNTAVHPESYPIVCQMAMKLQCTVVELIQSSTLQAKIEIQDYVSEKVGIPTLQLILEELKKPGRDPRAAIECFEFNDTVKTIMDLQVGMQLHGIVTNITRFGAFVDIGIKENGLVHVSNMANRFITDPAEVVLIHQHVKVKVLEIDIKQKRIQLSMKEVD